MAERGTVVVRGLTDLNRAFKVADKSLRREWRREQRAIAAPVAALAQELAIARIDNMPKSPQWSRMRIGVTQKIVYVAPRQKGTHGRGPRRRPNLANKLLDKAMIPALAANAANTLRAFDRLLDRMGRDWEKA